MNKFIYKYSFNKEKHLHLLNGMELTGTSSVVDVLKKEGLTWWASARALEPLGWTHSKEKASKRLQRAKEGLETLISLTDEKYLALLDTCYKAHKTKLDDSADKGIDLHAELETFIKAEMMDLPYVPEAYSERVNIFAQWAFKNVKEWLWSEAHCYSEKLWTGGIGDAGAILNDGRTALIDFKSAKEAYPGHFIQCGGYALEIEENGLLNADGSRYPNELKGEIGCLIVFPFGAKKIEPVFSDLPVEEYKKAFAYCVELYRFLGMDKKEKQ